MSDQKIIVVDRDRMAAQTIESVLKTNNFEAVVELAKEGAIKRVASGEGYFVIVDPSPQPDPRPFIIALRRNLPTRDAYVYIAVTSRDDMADNCLKRGANGFLNKPIRADQVNEMLVNGKRFIAFHNWLKRNENNNTVPSMGCLMGCESITQVLLSSIERADRYGEKTYLMEIRIPQMTHLKELMGVQKFEEYYKEFIQAFIHIRRQSDLFGRLAEDRFCIIMQRPVNDREPIDATERMRQNLERFIQNVPEYQDYPLRLFIQTLCIPTGAIVSSFDLANNKASGN